MRPSSRGGYLAALAFAAPALAPNGQPPMAVTVDAVRREAVQEHRKVTGELRAVRRSRVATQEPGLVLELPVEEGRPVARGDLLARLDSRRLDVQLEAMVADEKSMQGLVDERQATLDWRRRELELYRQSAQRGAANPKEILDAESTANIAKARLTQAQRQLDLTKARANLLRERLADMTIEAPFDGVVVTIHAEVGEWVGEGDAVVELVSIGEIEAWLQVPQKYFGVVSENPLEIAIHLDAAGRMINASRMRIIPMVDRRARSFSVVATLGDAGRRVTPGMSLTAWIPTGQKTEQLTIDRDAVLRNDAGAFVYVARGMPRRSGERGGSAEASAPASAVPVNIRVLFPVEDRLVVEARGLEAGDFVVVEGNERLFPMMPIQALPRAASEPSARR